MGREVVQLHQSGPKDDKIGPVSKVQSLLEQISEAVASVLPADLSADVRKNIKATVRGACEGLELVTREELEVQEAVLKRTREKVDRLEQQVSELESKVLSKQD